MSRPYSLSLNNLGKLGAVLSVQEGFAVLVQLELCDDDFRGVDGDRYGGA